MVSGSGSREGAGGNSGVINPEQARQEAADRMVGSRFLRLLQVVGVSYAIGFLTFACINDPDVWGPESAPVKLMSMGIFVPPALAGLATMLACSRRPARSDVPGLANAIRYSSIPPIAGSAIGTVALAIGVSFDDAGVPIVPGFAISLVVLGSSVVTRLLAARRWNSTTFWW